MKHYQTHVEKLRMDAAEVARLENLIAETMAEVNYLDWGLIEIRDCIRASRKAIVYPVSFCSD